MTLKVRPANASGDLSSLGDGLEVLIRQYRFPDTFDERDSFEGADSDRVFQWDYAHARRCLTEHTKSGEMRLGEWVKNAKPAEVLSFLRDFLKQAGLWTGFRVLGSVHRGNGYVVWSCQLFAKHPESKTKVYSGPRAPNVLWPKPQMVGLDGEIWDSCETGEN